ncbi:hypothetical protein GUJ93_ZPchr0013g34667 [Zizania palustris]|uniref:FHA domain-containing protein n=1 Tax=Zizania palustris TaxID=103762 RepID=A0A8J6C5Q5_ZIZPA|nr:hypothetical protein GUJ93_ZPchr0013g34667 [Zizania palustris]
MAAPPVPLLAAAGATSAIASLVIIVLIVLACRRWWRRSGAVEAPPCVAPPVPGQVKIPAFSLTLPVLLTSFLRTTRTLISYLWVVFHPLAILSSSLFCKFMEALRISKKMGQTTNEDLNRPLLENLDDQSNDFPGNVVGESSKVQTNRSNTSPRIHGTTDSVRVYSAEPCATQEITMDFAGEIHVIDVTNDISEEFHLGSTLKCTTQTSWSTPYQKHKRRGSREENQNGNISLKDNTYRSHLVVEVIAGPSHGISCSQQSTSPTIPITLGRVPPSDLVLKDSEVSGKHARINWNSKTLKWEIVDMGSLNGTFLNSRAVHHPDVGSRHWGEPAELADGDIITLGTSSKLSVQISLQNQQVPAGIGMSSDPMFRRSGKKIQMEDISFCQCPMQGVEQFALLGIFDGHGGDRAARAVSKILPENVSNLLSDHETKEKVLSCSDASDVLRCAFSMTEAAIDHEYEDYSDFRS